MRLDHLLSREIRVPGLRWVRSVDGSQVDRTIIGRPVRWVTPDLLREERAGEIDCDLATNTEPIRAFETSFPVTLQRSRVQPLVAIDRRPLAGRHGPGGRLAQLVRALP